MQNSESQVDVEMLSTPADVNSIYEEALENLRLRNMGEKGIEKKKPEKVLTEAEREMAAKDYYANVRTNVSDSPMSPLHLTIDSSCYCHG